jgi:hypothetical protein
MQTFEALLETRSPHKEVYITMPFLVVALYGSDTPAEVTGSIDSLPYGSAIVGMSDGTHALRVSKELLKSLGKQPGESVRVTLNLKQKLPARRQKR